MSVLKQKAPDDTSKNKLRLLALDRVTNPRNLGMIIRSATAGSIDGILLPAKGCAKLDSLVIKASAGTVFRAPVLRCDTLIAALEECKNSGARIVGLSIQSQIPIGDFGEPDFVVYVLGNETEGMGKSVEACCTDLVYIPMRNNVESLNVAITASLIAFRGAVFA